MHSVHIAGLCWKRRNVFSAPMVFQYPPLPATQEDARRATAAKRAWVSRPMPSVYSGFQTGSFDINIDFQGISENQTASRGSLNKMTRDIVGLTLNAA